MGDIETALNNFEESFRRLSGICKFQKTGSPNVFCTKLPTHWRSNKSLPTPFIVLILDPIPDGTKVTVAAGNEENYTADVKNNVTETSSQMARFSDLRFVGKSGRGKNFNLTITLHTTPMTQVAVVTSVIKVTVDGPRDSRNANKYINEYRKRGLPIDMIPSTSHFDFSHLPLKRGRFNQNGLLSTTTSASAHLPFEMFLTAAAHNPMNHMMLNMISTTPITSPLLPPLAVNPIFAATQLGLLQTFPPLNSAQPIHATASIMNTLNKSLESSARLKQGSDTENQEQSPRPNNEKEKSTSSLWRPYNIAK